MRDKNGRFIKGHDKSNTGRTHFKKGEHNGVEFKKGQRHTEEWKEKMSIFRKGKKLKNKIPQSNRELRLTIEYIEWRKSVLERDGKKCVDCGNTYKLEVHHIIPMNMLPSAYLVRANGVTLCKECHKKTNSYGGNGKEKLDIVTGISDLKYLMKVIPHNWQDYDTVGNYFTTSDGVRVIFVSKTEDFDYSFLIFLHEMIEQYLCATKEIKEQDIDKFDIEHPKLDDPGSHKDAPYHDQHLIATQSESMVAVALGKNWDKYDYELRKLKWRNKK